MMKFLEISSALGEGIVAAVFIALVLLVACLPWALIGLACFAIMRYLGWV